MPPPAGPEIAFAGRSNVGKSSLLNALTGRRALARVSDTPGRTRQLNFFDLGGRLTLVDMPGYGYARAGKAIKADWQGLMFDYLRGRPTLRRVMLLLDARIELKESDTAVMELLDAGRGHLPAGADQGRRAETARAGAQAGGDAAAWRVPIPPRIPSSCITSSLTGLGIPELRATLAMLAG